MTDSLRGKAPNFNRRRTGVLATVRRIGWPLVTTVRELGQVMRFLLMIVTRIPSCLARFSLVWRQLYFVGSLSMIIIIVAGAFIGLVLGLQFYNILSRYGQNQIVGAATALTLYRELGPVMAALLYVGSSCTAITASIGLKRASEQIAALEVMAVDPIEREIVPRFLAGILALPLLTLIMLAVAMISTYMIVVVQIGLDEGFFWSNIRKFAFFFGDVTQGMIKSVVFGAVTTLTALYMGYTARPTAEGVSKATTGTVVYSSLLVLGLDFVLTALMLN